MWFTCYDGPFWTVVAICSNPDGAKTRNGMNCNVTSSTVRRMKRRYISVGTFEQNVSNISFMHSIKRCNYLHHRNALGDLGKVPVHQLLEIIGRRRARKWRSRLSQCTSRDRAKRGGEQKGFSEDSQECEQISVPYARRYVILLEIFSNSIKSLKSATGKPLAKQKRSYWFR